MPRLSDMPPPDFPLTGLELVPVLQGAGLPGNRGVPILAYGHLPRGAVLALRVPMTADLSGTAEADPGAGNIRWNDADPHAATEIYLSDTDGDGGDLASAVASLEVGGFVYVQGAPAEARGNFQRWQVTGLSAESGYTALEVTLQASAGSFADDDELELVVQQPDPTPGVDRNLVTTAVSVGGALTLDAGLGDYFKAALHENVDALTISNAPTACTVAFWLEQDSTARTVAWPASFDWGEGNSAPAMPTGAGAELLVIISTYDAGGTWDAVARVRG